MAEPTLMQVFGAGATQSATTVTIAKADLAAVGLTVSANNTAESLLAAITVLAKSYLTPTAFAANSDQSVTIEPGYDSIVQRANSSGGYDPYKQVQFTLNFHSLDTSTFDPDQF